MINNIHSYRKRDSNTSSTSSTAMTTSTHGSSSSTNTTQQQHQAPPIKSRMTLFGVGVSSTLPNEDETNQLRSTFLRSIPKSSSTNKQLPDTYRRLSDEEQNRRSSMPKRMLATKAESFRIGRRMTSLDNSQRRLSLDEQLELQKASHQNQSTVSNYQEVFAQMKLEFPHSSLGALQQKTMARMAELKAQTLAKEREEHLKIQREREKEEAERLKKTLAVKYMSKWMNKAKLEYKEDDDGDNDGDDQSIDPLEVSTTTHPVQKRGSGGGGGFNDSFTRGLGFNDSHYSNSRHDSASRIGFNESSDNILTHLIPTGAMSLGRNTIMMKRRTSPATDGSRRASVDTTQSGLDSSRIDAGLIGDNQADNFAPRQSVGDLSVHLAQHGFGGASHSNNNDDRSAITDPSALENDETDSVERLSMKSSLNSVSRLDLELSDMHDGIDESGRSGVSSLGDGLRGAEDHAEQERESRARSLGVDDDIGAERRRSLSFSASRSDSTSIARSIGGRSIASEFTSDFSIMSCGLIVGFTDRSSLSNKKGLIVEFNHGIRKRKEKKEKSQDDCDNNTVTDKSHDTEEDIKKWKERPSPDAPEQKKEVRSRPKDKDPPMVRRR